MLTRPVRDVLNRALGKYRPGQTIPILVGTGDGTLKSALRLMTYYRLKIDETNGSKPVTSYTRWVDAVQTKGDSDKEVYVTFSPQFEHIWLKAKKRLPSYATGKRAELGLRSQYAIRLYAWAKKYAGGATPKRISLAELRKLLGLESVTDQEGNVVQEAALPVWANFRQRVLDVASRKVNKKTDLKITVKKLERSKHRRVMAPHL